MTPKQQTLFEIVDAPDFDGCFYDSERDKARLTRQQQDIYECLLPGEWVTVKDIAAKTNHPETSISAQARNLRKEKFGGHKIEGRYRPGTTLYEYRLGGNDE